MSRSILGLCVWAMVAGITPPGVCAQSVSSQPQPLLVPELDAEPNAEPNVASNGELNLQPIDLPPLPTTQALPPPTASAQPPSPPRPPLSSPSTSSPRANDHPNAPKLELPYQLTGERYSYGGWSAAAFLLPYLVPVVHGVHGNWGTGFLSLAGFYASFIGGAYLGAAIATSSNGGLHGTVIPFEMMLFGALAAVGWVIFDANVLAYDYRPRPERRLPTLAAPSTVRQ